MHKTQTKHDFALKRILLFYPCPLLFVILIGYALTLTSSDFNNPGRQTQYVEDLIHETSTCFISPIQPLSPNSICTVALMKIHDFKRKKLQHQKISMLTCYDYPSARIIAESKIDCVLVGDSVAMTMHGHDNTINATLEMMVLHTSAVARGLINQFLIADLPFLAHRMSLEKTVDNVRQLMQAGAHAVKMEGADDTLCKTIHHLVSAGVPVMGHIGLTPQSFHQLGGYAVQGKEQKQADLLLKQAQNLQNAGCFSIVIECVPQAVAKAITQALAIPTIGIGAGTDTDGQVMVWHDLLGLQTDFKPRFVKHYLQGKETLLTAIDTYAQEVLNTSFPTADHAY